MFPGAEAKTKQGVEPHIHGAENDHSVWGLQSRWFAHHGFSVLAVDLPGHGRSEGALLPSVEAQADWLVSLLDAAGVKAAALVGHSMGSLISLEAASRFPERVAKIALVGSAVPMPVPSVITITVPGRSRPAPSFISAMPAASASFRNATGRCNRACM